MRDGGAEKAQIGYCMRGSMGRDRDFQVATELLVICRDMVPKLQVVVGSRQGFSLS